ncbi:MAG: DUF938 domain-containing protein [Snowella sp.]|nr:DUF938 domain-containing protein [Snowella sp.]
MNNLKEYRQYAPATERNRQPILTVLQQLTLPPGNILEIAGGTGEHACFFAPYFAPRLWIPSDPDPTLRLSIEAWRQECKTDNLQPPLTINAMDPVWEVEKDNSAIAAIVAINLIHISPWSACQGLIAGAERILPTGGILYLYGPYKQQGNHTAPSNEAFDQSLKMRNSQWGVRDLEAVIEVAEKHGLEFKQIVAMPANNLSVIFQHL